jgi:hypothetical protein
MKTDPTMQRSMVLLVIGLAGITLSRARAADESLHTAIDRLIDAKAGDTPKAPAADDAEFLRRVMLDLAGRIPTSAETTRFLDDKASNNRDVLIDSLLAGEDYPRRMQELFHAMLMERRGEHAEWTKFLRHAFANNLPWDQVARAMLAPDSGDERPQPLRLRRGHGPPDFRSVLPEPQQLRRRNRRRSPVHAGHP